MDLAAYPPAYPPNTVPEALVKAAGPPAYPSKPPAYPPAYPPNTVPEAPVKAAGSPAYPSKPPAYPPNTVPEAPVKAAGPPAYTEGNNKPPKSSVKEKVEIPKGANPQQQAALDAAAKLAEETSANRTAYAYTQGDFWGGPNANFTILAALACFPLTGFVGLDHHYLRSPMTAALKTLLNIFTLGMWYFYDMGQVLSEADHVMKFGYSMPFAGPVGLGAGIFPKKNETAQGPGPVIFMLYSVASTIGSVFGLDHLVAGDFGGFIAKIFALPIWILLMWWNPLYWIAMLCALIWAGISIYRLWFNTEDIFARGIARFFPFTIFMDNYKCVNGTIGPDKPCDANIGNTSGTFSAILNFVRGIPVVGAAVSTVETTVNTTVEAVKIAGKLGGEVVKQTVAPVIGAAQLGITTATQLVSAGQQAATEAVKVASLVASNPAAVLQRGGSNDLQRGGSNDLQRGGSNDLQRGGSNDLQRGGFRENSNSLYLLGALIVAASGFTQYLRRADFVNLAPSFFQKTMKVRTDLPPGA